MLIGYMRVSKSDATQTLDLQRDALLAVGVAPERSYNCDGSLEQAGQALRTA
jgi:DNA invertase Pin-like site-specific DNA recombinase